jgi:hypothetical protein
MSIAYLQEIMCPIAIKGIAHSVNVMVLPQLQHRFKHIRRLLDHHLVP